MTAAVDAYQARWVIEALFKRKTKLADTPTVRQAMLAIAQLGGHIKNNGDPGWLVLGRGFEELLILEEGARAVLEM